MKKRKKRVVKKVKKEKEGRVCWFCGSSKKLERHHVIPVSIGGKHLENNKVDICSDCHPKLHKLLDPVIQYLVAIIQQLQKEEVKEPHRIGFIWKNGKKSKKLKVLDNKYHTQKGGEPDEPK